jgi:glycerophosphoryl diester phosphodiesterase
MRSAVPAAISWLRDRPLLVAHRGLRARVPEQTMASFTAAIEHGAEMIEADAQLSLDGELVLMHDDTVDRTTDGHGLVGDLTWTELSRLDAGSWFDPAFSGLRIPRARDLLDLARDSGIGLCLEAKGPTSEYRRDVAVALAALIADHGATQRAFLSSFDHEALAAARASVPDLMLAPERLPEHGPQAAGEAVRQALALGAPVIQHRWELITADLVETLHEARIAIWAWNTNDYKSTRVSIDLGVDGVIGDDVEVLVAGRAAHEAGLPGATPS